MIVVVVIVEGDFGCLVRLVVLVAGETSGTDERCVNFDALGL